MQKLDFAWSLQSCTKIAKSKFSSRLSTLSKYDRPRWAMVILFDIVNYERAMTSRHVCTDVGLYPSVSGREWQSMYGTHIGRLRLRRLGMPLFYAISCAGNICMVGYYAQPQNLNLEISPFWENPVLCKYMVSACHRPRRSCLLSRYLGLQLGVSNAIMTHCIHIVYLRFPTSG